MTRLTDRSTPQMKTYLVDMENAHTRWRCIIPQFMPEDKLLLFYSENIPSIPMQVLNDLFAARVGVEAIICRTGPNALDFQLVSELGARINADPKSAYVIVSSDHDYDVVIQYWRDRNITISRYIPPARLNTDPRQHIAAAVTRTTTPVNAVSQELKVEQQDTNAEQTDANAVKFIPAAKRHVLSEHDGKDVEIHQLYVDKLVEIGIPAEHTNKVATAIFMSMDKLPKRRRVSIYNGILAAFGKQSGTLYYKKAEYVISDILTNGPFPTF